MTQFFRSILVWVFVLFGSSMGVLCLVVGIAKIMNGKTSFRGARLFEHMNEFKGSLSDFSGTEIFVVGLLLILATLLFYYLQ